MKMLWTLGRIIYAVPFAVFGVFHLAKGSQMAGMVPSWVPGGVLWVYVTGLCMLAASIAIITKKKAALASLCLAALLGVYILTIHLPGLANPQTMQMSMMGLLKDLGLMGGALAISGVFAARGAR